MTRARRTHKFDLRLFPAESEQWKTCAARENMFLSSWIRAACTERYETVMGRALIAPEAHEVTPAKPQDRKTQAKVDPLKKARRDLEARVEAMHGTKPARTHHPRCLCLVCQGKAA